MPVRIFHYDVVDIAGAVPQLFPAFGLDAREDIADDATVVVGDMDYRLTLTDFAAHARRVEIAAKRIRMHEPRIVERVMGSDEHLGQLANSRPVVGRG
jgi:hypothetical protein